MKMHRIMNEVRYRLYLLSKVFGKSEKRQDWRIRSNDPKEVIREVLCSGVTNRNKLLKAIGAPFIYHFKDMVHYEEEKRGIYDDPKDPFHLPGCSLSDMVREGAFHPDYPNSLKFGGMYERGKDFIETAYSHSLSEKDLIDIIECGYKLERFYKGPFPEPLPKMDQEPYWRKGVDDFAREEDGD